MSGGEFFDVWEETWAGVWTGIPDESEDEEQIFAEMYKGMFKVPQPPVAPEPTEFDGDGEIYLLSDFAARDEYDQKYEAYRRNLADYEDAVSGGERSADLFRRMVVDGVKNEIDAVNTLKDAHRALFDINDTSRQGRFFDVVGNFIGRHNLFYDLRAPFEFFPTFSGIFARLIRELKKVTNQEDELRHAMEDFEEAFRDLKSESSPGHIATCFNKQFILTEALAKTNPKAQRKNVLSDMCGEINSWPHHTVQQTAEKIYAFRGAFPGLVHAGSGATRKIDMRDLIAVSIILAGLSPYLIDQINPETIYHSFQE